MGLGQDFRVTKTITAQNTFTDPVSIGSSGYAFVFITDASSNADVVIQIQDESDGSWSTVYDFITGDSTTGKYTKSCAVRVDGKPGTVIRAGVLTGDYASGTVVITIRDA